MKKTLILFIYILFSFLTVQVAFSASFSVEDIFSDIDKSYKYYKELQALYDRGMIFPDKNGRFNPNKLLNRDEFVGISQEVVCKKCISPNTDIDLIKDYIGTKPFFDVSQSNKYFYCIADAKQNSFVAGYNKDYRCEDDTYSSDQEPFCINNKITLEEAIAVILRNSGIFTIKDNKKVLDRIYAGENFSDLSDDVSARNLDDSPYTFYGYLQKALDYELVEYDKYGNQKIYRLLELKDNKIRPKQSITKQEFLRISYIAFKANSCLKIEEDELALKIDLLVGGISGTGIKKPENYIWRFYNLNTGEEIKKYGNYINNYKFLSDGTWKMYLRVIDDFGNTGEVHNTIVVKDKNMGSKASIEAVPIAGIGPLKVDFKGFTNEDNGNYNYEWDFGDGKGGYGKNITHIFTQAGVYKTRLFVTDSSGNIADASILIKVNKLICDKDSDLDQINDCIDECPLVIGEEKNDGCPVFPDISKPTFNGCSYRDKSVIIFGNAICNNCPCSNFLDFNVDLRECDLIFPAITSPDSKEIYSRGDFWEIK